jgi:hypothetical protein
MGNLKIKFILFIKKSVEIPQTSYYSFKNYFSDEQPIKNTAQSIFFNCLTSLLDKYFSPPPCPIYLLLINITYKYLFVIKYP